jgi:hypothetical protein
MVSTFRDLLGEHRAAANVEIWSWVLMPNHVHLILAPNDDDGLAGRSAIRPFSIGLNAKAGARSSAADPVQSLLAPGRVKWTVTVTHPYLAVTQWCARPKLARSSRAVPGSDRR